MCPIGWKKFFVIKNIKNTVPWAYVINGEKIIGTFYKK